MIEIICMALLNAHGTIKYQIKNARCTLIDYIFTVNLIYMCRKHRMFSYNMKWNFEWLMHWFKSIRQHHPKAKSTHDLYNIPCFHYCRVCQNAFANITKHHINRGSGKYARRCTLNVSDITVKCLQSNNGILST